MCIGNTCQSFVRLKLAQCFYIILMMVHVNATGTGMGAAAVFERGDSVDDLSNARVEANGSGHQNKVEYGEAMKALSQIKKCEALSYFTLLNNEQFVILNSKCINQYLWVNKELKSKIQSNIFPHNKSFNILINPLPISYSASSGAPPGTNCNTTFSIQVSQHLTG